MHLFIVIYFYVTVASSGDVATTISIVAHLVAAGATTTVVITLSATIAHVVLSIFLLFQSITLYYLPIKVQEKEY